MKQQTNQAPEAALREALVAYATAYTYNGKKLPGDLPSRFADWFLEVHGKEIDNRLTSAIRDPQDALATWSGERRFAGRALDEIDLEAAAGWRSAGWRSR